MSDYDDDDALAWADAEGEELYRDWVRARRRKILDRFERELRSRTFGGRDKCLVSPSWVLELLAGMRKDLEVVD